MKRFYSWFTLLPLIALWGCNGTATPEVWLIAGQSNAVFSEAIFRDILVGDGIADEVHGVAKSATFLDCWQPAGSCFAARSVRDELENPGLRGIVWWQGEADGGVTDPEVSGTYGDRLIAMIQEWRDIAGWQVPFFLIELQRFNPALTGDELGMPGDVFDEPSDWIAVRAGQYQAAAALDGVVIVPTQDITFGEGHPRSSYLSIARRTAEAIK